MKSLSVAVLALLGKVSAVDLKRGTFEDPEFYESVALMRTASHKDAYDLDANTVSQYDGMEKHKTGDWSFPFEGV